MTRAAFRTSMLLSVSVYLLLCLACCAAKPMGASSSGSRNTVSPNNEPFPNVHVRPSLQYDESLEAQVQSRPFYQSYPVFNTLLDELRLIHYGRRKHGAAWLRQWDAHARRPRYKVDLYRDGQPAAPARNEEQSVRDWVRTAFQIEADHGPAARLLLYGPPFQATFADPHTWSHVWENAGVHPVPSTVAHPDWLDLRQRLQAQRQIVLRDSARPFTLLGFRLDRDGTVEMAVKRLERGIRKRSDPSSPEEHRRAKRMYEPGPSSTYNGREDAIHSFNYYFGKRFQYRAPLQPLTDEQREHMFADTIYHKGTPILVGGQVYESKVQHALYAHDPIWMTSVSNQNPLAFDPPIRMLRGGQIDLFGAEAAAARLAAAAQARTTYGEKPMYLMYGKPFAARQPNSLLSRISASLGSYSKPSWNTVNRRGTLFNLAETELVRLRQHLDRNNFLKVVDSAQNKVWGLRLAADGQVEIKDLTDVAHRIRKRMMPGTTNSRQIEFYLQHRIPKDARLRSLSDAERGYFFSNDLHHDGEPVFSPATDPKAFVKVKQAMHDYPGYWIVGSSTSNPALTTASRIDSRTHEISRHGDQEVLDKVRTLNTLASVHDRDTYLLQYGPGFPKRKKPSLLGRYQTPSWETVRARAPKVAVEAPMYDKWMVLHDQNMLVVTDGHSQMGYALNKAGQVLRHSF